MWLHLPSFQEELAQLCAAPGSAIPFPGHGNAGITVPMGSGCSSPSHPVLEEGSEVPPWNCDLHRLLPSPVPTLDPRDGQECGCLPCLLGHGVVPGLIFAPGTAQPIPLESLDGKISWEQPRVPGVCVTPGRCTWLSGGFSLLPPFLLPSLPSFLLLFWSPPEQTGRSLPNLVNEPGDKRCSRDNEGPMAR